MRTTTVTLQEVLGPHARPVAAPSVATALELALTTAACVFLFWLALPLGMPGADLGLQQRYAAAMPPASWDWFMGLYAAHAWDAPGQDLRAVALARGAGLALALMGYAGWLALQLARTGAPWARGAALGLWAAVAWVLRPYQVTGAAWATLAVLALLWSSVAFLQSRQGRAGRPGTAATPNPWVACVWPGWLLLGGIGCVLMLDFGARGPVVPGGMALSPPEPGARYFGLHQVDAFWLASGILLAVAAWRRHLLYGWVSLCGLLADLWRRQRGPWLLGGTGVALTLALAWLGYFQSRAFLHLPGVGGAGKPHISGELLRLAACGVLAWFAYRSGEWAASPRRVWDGLCHASGLLALCALGFLLSDDNGPLLVLALALGVLAGVPLVRWLAVHAGGWLAVLLAGALVAGATVAWQQAQIDWLPQISSTAGCRKQMLDNKYEACSPNLAQAHWLMDAMTPVRGPRIARVPYCGAAAHAGRRPCTLGSGAPLQLPSDFAFAVLHAAGGAWGAAACVTTLLLWLFALTAGQLQAWRQAPTATRYRALLPVWLVAVPATVAQAQVVVSVGATLGWSLLTGVTLPLLGYGSVALCAMALWVGLAAHAGHE